MYLLEGETGSTCVNKQEVDSFLSAAKGSNRGGGGGWRGATGRSGILDWVRKGDDTLK